MMVHVTPINVTAIPIFPLLQRGRGEVCANPNPWSIDQICRCYDVTPMRRIGVSLLADTRNRYNIVIADAIQVCAIAIKSGDIE